MDGSIDANPHEVRWCIVEKPAGIAIAEGVGPSVPDAFRVHGKDDVHVPFELQERAQGLVVVCTDAPMARQFAVAS